MRLCYYFTILIYILEYCLEIDDDTFHEKIYSDYGKTKQEVGEYVDMLTKWAETQKHLPEIPPTQTIRYILVVNKFSMERTKEKITMYYVIRNLMPEIFSRHPLSAEMILHSKIIYCIPLPKPTSGLHRILYICVNPAYGPEHFDHELFIVHLNHVIELLILEDKCYNFHVILDVGAVKIGHVPKFNPMNIKKIVNLFEKVYGNRTASIYIVNFHSFMEYVANTLFIPLLPSKIKARIKIYDNADVLLKVYDKSIMPKDIGGEERSLEELHECLLKKFEKYKARFDKIQYMKLDESLRPAKLENDDILGYYGSFKAINVD